jgi:hypothetical protein
MTTPGTEAAGDSVAEIAIGNPPSLIRWHYLWYVAGSLVVMVAAIIGDNFWFLNFVHVFTGLLWTGIDLFMGFVLGPVLRKTDIGVRREIAVRLVPRTLFLMPTISIITGTTGWFLAVKLGYLELPWPQFAWVAAALVLITLMTIQGLFMLTPINVMVCLELQKPKPDLSWIALWMRRYFFMVATQGTMQVLIVIVMTRFRAGL